MIYGYCRVSTTEQAASDKSSLAEQERRVRGCAMMRGEENITLFFDPGVSGSTPLSKRAGGAKLLAVLKPNDVVVASKLDRLFRSASDALLTVEGLQRRGVGVVLADIGTDPVTESGTSKLFFTMLSAFAEFERTRIAERMMEGKNGKRERDGFIGGSPPYGFLVVGSGRDSRLVANVEEQAVVKVASELSQNRSPYKVCLELDRRGIRNRAGGEFQPIQIRRMVSRVRAEAAE